MAGGYTVERSLDMQAPPETIHALIDDLHAWPKWSPWEELDPTMERSYEGPDAGPGASYSWKGNKQVGQGRMTVRDSEAPARVVLDLAFLKPFKSESVTTFLLEPAGEGTTVRWRMDAKHTFMTRLFSLFASFDKMIGKDFEKGLAKLKTVAEAS